jgi:hypothetical protein
MGVAGHSMLTPANQLLIVGQKKNNNNKQTNRQNIYTPSVQHSWLCIGNLWL